MSLIDVARQVSGPRTLTRAVLAALVISLGIIAGLLAMHSFNSHATTAGHHGTVAVSAQSGASEHHHDAASAASAALLPSSPATTEGCATCGGGDPMTWMACVLALLVATILFRRAGLGWRHTPLTVIPATTTPQWHARAHDLPPPPSLTVLCISRT
ncbi:hypothetical protein AB0O14_09570 [Microbacterium foliorum]|uniref:hypothetical protein n=1 Tax=Microbacterium sp. Leaf161 TaxID=1736281 RepID=UPI0006FA6BA4|nr:hypothetical protein [Microbacterium sp. Leaf161]KQR48711.1 hypothetical protein ASF87_07650 [Microbacterium sp. Leaf161]